MPALQRSSTTGGEDGGCATCCRASSSSTSGRRVSSPRRPASSSDSCAASCRRRTPTGPTATSSAFGRRGTGLARELYERLFAAARGHGRTLVRCVTSPANRGSLSFHARLGFEVEQEVADYDGAGESRMVLVKRL